MIYIPVNQACAAVLRIPDSTSGDTVTYVIYKASDGSTFASGSATFVAGNNWKVSFTPTVVDETYIVELTLSDRDIKTTEIYRATTSSQVAVEQTTATTTAELLAKVESAISARLNGGAVQSYMINGRNVMYMTLGDLMKFRDQLKAEINSTKTGTRTYVTFADPQ